MKAPARPDQSGTGDSPPPLEVAELSERCMGNTAIATLLLDKFEKQLAHDIPEIERHLAAGDAAEIARTIHALRGAAGAVAASVLRDLAGRLEVLAQQEQLAAIAQELSVLREEAERCLDYMPVARGLLIPPGRGPRGPQCEC